MTELPESAAERDREPHGHSEAASQDAHSPAQPDTGVPPAIRYEAAAAVEDEQPLRRNDSHDR